MIETRSSRSITSEAAAELVSKAVAKGAPVSIAVVDPAGELLAFHRMDGAPAFSARLAIAKARTAAAFGRPTADMESLFEGRDWFGAGFLPLGPWFVSKGGAPILLDGECVGAVGLSGNTAEHEDAVARELAAS
jgi:glc operon protein GlcG